MKHNNQWNVNEMIAPRSLEAFARMSNYKFELTESSKEKMAKFGKQPEEEKKTDSKPRVEKTAAKTNQKRGRGRGAM